MAGHPTIATVHALVEAGRLSLTGEVTRLTLELPAGVIPVEIHARMGHIETIVMTQLEPSFLSVHDPWEIMPAFSLEPTDLIAEAPIQTVSTGTPQLMIPLKDHDALRRARLQSGLYTALREAADFFSPHLFCLGGVAGGDTFARHFGVPPDTDEDPFTGSATGAMAAYLWHHALIEKVDFMAEQGHWMGRPGRAIGGPCARPVQDHQGNVGEHDHEMEKELAHGRGSNGTCDLERRMALLCVGDELTVRLMLTRSIDAALDSPTVIG